MPPRKKASDAAPAAPTRVSARVKKAQDDAAASTTVPAPTAAKPPSKAKAPASKAKAKSKMATVDSGDEEDVPAAAKPASKPKAPVSKPKSKAGKRARADSDEDEDETDSKPAPKKSKKASSSQNDVADDADDAKPAKMVTVIKRGAAPVDPSSGKVDTHMVYSSGQEVWDAMLNQTDVSSNQNKNKFYVLQLLHPIGNDSHSYLYTRWGRVGETGQSQIKGPWPSSTAAISEFKKQFKSKTGVNWENRVGMTPAAKKYTWLERDYNDEEGEETESKASGKMKVETPIPPSALAPEIQEFAKLIFNTSIIDATLSAMNYDARKLPLGKLAKGTILSGFSALKNLAEVINDPTGTAAQEYGTARAACERLSSAYYSIIPHDFGRNRPVVIDNAILLKRELDLVDALGDMEIASKLMQSSNDQDAEGKAINPIDAQFRSLALTSMEPVPKDSAEFKNLEKYAKDTHGATHSHIRANIKHIYRVERETETQSWKKGGFDDLADGERLLLWHGSRATNFAGILKQGLRIAPPEAPVTGYMFGKGAYFADMMSKSAGYCYSHLSGNVGILLLCEVAAKPFYERTQAEYNADVGCKKNKALATKGLGRTQPTKWKDAGKALNNEELVGCQMPDGGVQDVSSTIPGVYLQYNEYIVYDVSQIKVKYLFMVDM